MSKKRGTKVLSIVKIEKHKWSLSLHIR